VLTTLIIPGQQCSLFMRMRLVLVVEDSETEAELLEEGLRDAIPRGAVVAIRSTSEAERYLFSESGELSPAPSLLVIDTSHPGAPVEVLLRRVRADYRTKTIPVVMLSERLGDLEVQDLYRSGANSCLDRPLDSDQFVSMVSAAARYWLGLNLSVPAHR